MLKDLDMNPSFANKGEIRVPKSLRYAQFHDRNPENDLCFASSREKWRQDFATTFATGGLQQTCHLGSLSIPTSPCEIDACDVEPSWSHLNFSEVFFEYFESPCSFLGVVLVFFITARDLKRFSSHLKRPIPLHCPPKSAE